MPDFLRNIILCGCIDYDWHRTNEKKCIWIHDILDHRHKWDWAKVGQSDRGAFINMEIDFNLSMDKWSHAQQSVGWSHLSIPKLQRLQRLQWL